MRVSTAASRARVVGKLDAHSATLRILPAENVGVGVGGVLGVQVRT